MATYFGNELNNTATAFPFNSPWTAYGRGRNDSLTGGNANDVIYGDYGSLPKPFFPIYGNDTLRGGNGNDSLYGEFGNDALYGDAGNDWLYGGNGQDSLYGGADNDYLYGGDGNDSLSGSSGADYLNGGTGADTMAGGIGNDTYVVDNVGDQVIETSIILPPFPLAIDAVSSARLVLPLSGGIDTVVSSISYSLGNNLENLNLVGSSNINGFGNSLNNVISGNEGNNYLYGADGNDSIYGYGGNDTLSGGFGNDTMEGGAGNDSLYGSAGADILIGVSQFSLAPGKGEVDTLAGGTGKDTFVLGARGKVFYDDGIATPSFPILQPNLLSRISIPIFPSVSGTADYARITDFVKGEDTIQLKGSFSNYVLQTGSFGGGSASDTRILLRKPFGEANEVIGVVQDVTGLNASNFTFVA